MKLITISRSIAHRLFLVIIVTTVNGCNVHNIVYNDVTDTKKEKANNETILFLGNPGVGKSSLLNSIVQRKMFESGVSHGQGKTTNRQSCSYNGVTYMDTPGLSDVSLRDQAAKEIERALKEDKNYKIVFVATLESGRIKPDDLTTINLVCESVKVDFKYGIIFNKVSEKVAQQVSNNPTQWAPYIETLAKKPCDILIILRDLNMDDEENALLPVDSENRKKLIDFITGLSSNRILPEQVQAVGAKEREIRLKLERETEAMKRELEEEKRRQQEYTKQLEDEKERQRALEREREDLQNKIIAIEEMKKFMGRESPTRMGIPTRMDIDKIDKAVIIYSGNCKTCESRSGCNVM